jgi:hypothetical protein
VEARDLPPPLPHEEYPSRSIFNALGYYLRVAPPWVVGGKCWGAAQNIFVGNPNGGVNISPAYPNFTTQ